MPDHLMPSFSWRTNVWDGTIDHSWQQLPNFVQYSPLSYTYNLYLTNWSHYLIRPSVVLPPGIFLLINKYNQRRQVLYLISLTAKPKTNPVFIATPCIHRELHIKQTNKQKSNKLHKWNDSFLANCAYLVAMTASISLPFLCLEWLMCKDICCIEL